MVVFTLGLVAAPHEREELLQTIRPLLGPTRVQPGCVSCRFYQDVDEPRALTLMQEWATRSDLDRYIRSKEYKMVLAAMDLSDRPPEVEFSVILKTKGIEWIEKALRRS